MFNRTPVRTIVLWLAGTVSLILGASIWLSRDPDRPVIPEGVVAAADGTIRAVDRLPNGRSRVSTYMSPLDVHVNRAPIAGIITSVERKRGGYRPAARKDSERNERVCWHIMTDKGDVEIIQIAGTLTRRIVAFLPVGATVEKGERIGLIRFGSRVDVILPPAIAVAVSVGQKVYAGVTRIDSREG